MRHEKIALINTPSQDYAKSKKIEVEQSSTPYGLASVATFAKVSGIDVQFIDAENFGLSRSQVVKSIGKDATMIGLNVLTPTFIQSIHLAKSISSERPDSQIVFGGPHATLDPESILWHIPQGVVVVGDGEKPFVQLAEGEDLEQIDGLATTQNGQVKRSHIRASVTQDLDSLPWIDRDFTRNEPCMKGDKRSISFLSSRGCAGNCGFCITPAQFNVMKNYGARRMRFRDMKDVINEVDSLRDTFDIAQFIDDDMLPNVTRAKQFIELWKRHNLSEKEFRCLLTPNQIVAHNQAGLLQELHDLGLRKISLGIETGHDRGRQMVSGGAGIDSKYNESAQIAAVQACSRAGISTKGFFMVGFPGETREEIEQTLTYMKKMGEYGLQRANVFMVKVYPYTKLWQQAIEMGFSPEELGDYNSESVQNMLEKGIDVTDIRNNAITQDVQLSEIPNDELVEICQNSMNNFRKEFSNEESGN